MTEEQQLNTIFYSQKCNHCVKLLNIIQSNNQLKGTFILENIHDSKNNLMNTIKSVPTIFSQKTKQLYIGKKAFDFVENELNLNLNAFEDYSSFSYIENPDSGSNNGVNFAYLLGDGYDVPNSNQKDSSQTNQNSKEKKQNDEYEEFMEKRKLDMPTPFKRV